MGIEIATDYACIMYLVKIITEFIYLNIFAQAIQMDESIPFCFMTVLEGDGFHVTSQVHTK